MEKQCAICKSTLPKDLTFEFDSKKYCSRECEIKGRGNGEEIKVSLDYLADLCLKNNGIITKYSDEDFINATIIFMELFSNKIFEYQRYKLTQKQLEILAEESGKSLRQTIKLFTGLDTVLMVKTLYDLK